MRARDNPFRAARVEGLKYRLDIPWQELVERWTVLGRFGALVGPPGSGKTTLLENFAEVLRARGEKVQLARLRGGEPPALEPGAVALLDGVEEMDRTRWRVLHLRLSAAVITLHTPRLLSTLWDCRTTPALLDGLLDELGASAWRDAGRRLFAEKRGDLRQVFRALYDLAST